MSIDNSGNVGIGSVVPAYKLDVGASGSDVISVRLTPGYERVRYHGFDLLGYNDGNLWMIGNNATNTLVLAGSWDWDRQIAIAYTPATTGAAGGSLEIGQTTKNNANFTHGNTRFYTNGIERLRIISSGNVGIGTTGPTYRLQVNGSFAATTKSFDIPHPTKENKRLIYASLEGPENGVYVRGKNNSEIIELPDYWVGLVHEDSITVTLTSIGKDENKKIRNYSMEKIENNKVYIYTDSPDNIYNYYFVVYGERKDVSKLIVEKENE